MRHKHCGLEAWKEAIVLVKMICQMTSTFPASELFGLSAQMRRAAVSIPSNIAEAAVRNTNRQLIQFLYIARGSLSELETQTIITRELGYLVPADTTDQQIDREFSLLSGLIRSSRGTPQ